MTSKRTREKERERGEKKKENDLEELTLPKARIPDDENVNVASHRHFVLPIRLLGRATKESEKETRLGKMFQVDLSEQEIDRQGEILDRGK